MFVYIFVKNVVDEDMAADTADKMLADGCFVI